MENSLLLSEQSQSELGWGDMLDSNDGHTNLSQDLRWLAETSKEGVNLLFKQVREYLYR